MSYELLSKLYYKNKTLFNEEYERRKNGIYSVSLGVSIHGAEGFYVNLPDFLIEMTNIYKKSAELEKLCAKLPTAAYDSYARKCLVDEIILSNDMEGIRSTRKEILSVLNEDRQKPRKKRFQGMVHKYVMLLAEDTGLHGFSLHTPEDVRQLYDEFVLDEIAEADHPDGKLFRKEIAQVISGTQQVKHTGLFPEAEIISSMEKTLAIFERPEIPALYKIAIFHYMIGYIHPFYDGNGRLSRFISSYLLKQEFNTLVALRLSYSIKDRKNDYYKAFDTVNAPHNKGDMTPFLIYFSDVMTRSLESLLERLRTGKEMLETYEMLLDMYYKQKAPNEKKKTQDVMWYLIQNELFSVDPMDKKDLAGLLKTNPQTAHHYVEKLIADNAPITVEKEGRKFVYLLDLDKTIDYLRSKDTV